MNRSCNKFLNYPLWEEKVGVLLPAGMRSLLVYTQFINKLSEP
ncbi:MAG: hypothetical protein PUP93_25750 [Rhizonema sp. NSF051]|nr:hypothetical protein [Rhizonema sp. NSF051]